LTCLIQDKGRNRAYFETRGFISDYVVESGERKILRVYLKYDARQEPVIRGLRRFSKSGLRRYAGADSLPKVFGGMGIAILSTSSGMMTTKRPDPQDWRGSRLYRMVGGKRYVKSGQKPVEIPSGVTVKVAGATVTAKGRKAN